MATKKKSSAKKAPTKRAAKKTSAKRKSPAKRAAKKTSAKRKSPTKRAAKKTSSKRKSPTKRAAKTTSTKRKGASKRYGQKSHDKVGAAMHEMKQGKLRSGRSGQKVKNPKQAIAIGLSEARRSGGKVPPAKKRAKAR